MTHVMPVILLALAAVMPLAQRPQPATVTCQPSGGLVHVPGVAELSGLAVSRSTPGRLWTNNDSGAPTLVALDAGGSVVARVRLTGVKFADWEAISVGPCPAGSCIYAADIGDNDGARRRVAIYRFAEPATTQTSVSVTDVFYATYPDGPRDAETLLVTPGGALYIVTKGDRGPVALYRFPRELRVGTDHPLERIGDARAGERTASRDWVTDGTVSANGQWVALRTRHRVTFHRAARLLSGEWPVERTIELDSIQEPQGEAVALGDGGTVYLGGEGGPMSAAGTFARFTCAGMW
jgi:hypothetical protein